MTRAATKAPVCPTRWFLCCYSLICVFLTTTTTSDAWMTSNRLVLGQRRLQASSSSSSSSSTPIETIHGQWNSTVFGATHCWGRRPLLMRQAFDVDTTTTTAALPSWDDIVSLACCGNDDDDDDDDEEEPIPARLIQHQPGTLDTYRVQFGPFRPDELKSSLLPSTNEVASTLVVNDVDRFIPDLSDWIDSHFSFLPRWRRDDAQMSLAPMGGGIGPHVDNYDVFLIQTSGSREWEVGVDHTISVHDEFAHLVEASQVRILNMTTNSSVKLQLQAGDCLYVPPRVMHFGSSTSNDCVTLSVGCRTPSAADLLSRMAESMATSTKSAAVERYTDPNLLLQSSSDDDKRLSSRVKETMKRLVLQLVDDLVEDDAAWDELVGTFLTEPNRPTSTSTEYPTPLSAMDDEWKDELGIWADANATLDSVFGTGTGVLRRAEGVSFAWSALPSSSTSTTSTTTMNYRLYAQGRVFDVDDDAPSTPSLLCRLANGPPLDQDGIRELRIQQLSPNIRKFLHALLEEGFLYGDDDEPK